MLSWSRSPRNIRGNKLVHSSTRKMAAKSLLGHAFFSYWQNSGMDSKYYYFVWNHKRTVEIDREWKCWRSCSALSSTTLHLPASGVHWEAINVCPETTARRGLSWTKRGIPVIGRAKRVKEELNQSSAGSKKETIKSTLLLWDQQKMHNLYESWARSERGVQLLFYEMGG